MRLLQPKEESLFFSVEYLLSQLDLTSCSTRGWDLYFLSPHPLDQSLLSPGNTPGDGAE